MKITQHLLKYCLLVMLFITLATAPSLAAESSDILITSIGQSADARMINVLATRHEIEMVYDQLAKPEMIKDYKIIIAVVGGSSKGLGAAGINQEDEIARTKLLLQEIQAQQVKLLVMHVGGEARRGALSDAFLDEIVPYADHLIIVKSGDMDGYFTNISREKEIKMEVVEKIVDTGELVKAYIAEQLVDQ